MTAIIVPFPIVRRQAFIRKQVEHVTLMNPDAGARYVEYQLQVQRDAMRRRGIAEHLVQRELLCMRRALQAEFAGRVLQPDR